MTRNDRFNAGLRSVDRTDKAYDASKDPRMSEHGAVIERMLDEIDRDTHGPHTSAGDRNASAAGAVLRLVWTEKQHLIPVLLLIFKHGKNRGETMKIVTRSTYYWARNALLKFFIGL